MIVQHDSIAEFTSTLGEGHGKSLMILSYDTNRPFEVELIFPGNPSWTFAKSILFDALTYDGTQGLGDVQLLDDDDETGNIIFFLSSPDGIAALKVRTNIVVDFADEIRQLDFEYADQAKTVVRTALDDFLTNLTTTSEE